MKDILYSPYLLKYKAPLGALCFNEEATINIYINKTFNIWNLNLVIRDDTNSYHKSYSLNMDNTCDCFYNIYTCKISLDEYYLFFYHFEFDDVYGHHYIYSDDFMDAYLTDSIGKEFQINSYNNFKSDLEWFKGKTMYQIFVDRFNVGIKDKYNNPNKYYKGAYFHKNWNEGMQYKPVNNEILNNDFFGGDLLGIVEKLDYLKELGINVLYLNPIFESSSNHKYNTKDYLKVDKAFGGDDALKELIIKAKEKGISIILDGVFNHTGSDSKYFNLASTNPNSKYKDWYFFNSYPDKYEAWWGIKTLPKVNTNSSFKEFITGQNGVLQKWLNLGVKGYRLDVVDEYDDSFTQAIASSTKSNNNDNIIIGEVWEDASNKIAYSKRKTYLNGKELDSVMNYPLKNAIIAYIKDNKMDELVKTMNMLVNNYPKHVLDANMNMLSTHDTMRILSVFDNSCYQNLSKDEKSTYLMDTENYEDAICKLKLASTLAFTLPGVPCIFYGDEIGTEGFEDPFCRKTFRWDNINQDLLSHYKKLTNIRNTNKVYQDGDYKQIEIANNIFGFIRSKDDDSIITIINNSDNNYSYNINGIDLFTNNEIKNNIILEKKHAYIVKIRQLKI